jgi:outer membrane protein assembly factor BamB
MKKRLLIAVCLCAVILVVLRLPSPQPPVPIVWQASVRWYCGGPLSVGRDGTVYLPTVTGLLAIDRKGKQKWAVPDEFSARSSATIAPDGTIYLKEWGRRRPSDGGASSTNKGLLAFRPDGTVKWRFSINDIVENSGVAFALNSRGTVYFTAGKDFDDPKTLFAVSAEGRELWHFDSPGNMTAPAGISGDGTILFESWRETNADLFRLDARGKSLDPHAKIEHGSSNLSVDWDGTTYLYGDTENTMTALNANGSLRWRFKSPFRAFDAPTIGADGSLYFAARRQTDNYLKGDNFVLALTKEGREKWKAHLGSHWIQPPAVASDGTLFVVSSDPKVTALNPDGTVKWVFNPAPPTSSIRAPKSLEEFKNQLSGYFRTKNVAVGPATLTYEGTLYFGFGAPYDTFYALNVGVGLATNSPWPMSSGSLQMTRRVQDRPVGRTTKQTR